MICYWKKIGTNKWIKGTIFSLSSGSMVGFEGGVDFLFVRLGEINIHTDGLCVTGFSEIKDSDLYELISVDVRMSLQEDSSTLVPDTLGLDP